MAVGPKGIAGAARKAALPNYYYRLSARAQRTYLKSDSIDKFDLVAGQTALVRTSALMGALEFGAPTIVERASQALVVELCRLIGTPPVRVQVRGVRPHNARGELHGIFYPRGASSRPGDPLIILWMRTAQRHDVVKPKTFLRTLMHELGHYLDYAHLRLDDSFHTAGFFKRESYLVRILFPPEPDGA